MRTYRVPQGRVLVGSTLFHREAPLSVYGMVDSPDFFTTVVYSARVIRVDNPLAQELVRWLVLPVRPKDFWLTLDDTPAFDLKKPYPLTAASRIAHLVGRQVQKRASDLMGIGDWLTGAEDLPF